MRSLAIVGPSAIAPLAAAAGGRARWRAPPPALPLPPLPLLPQQRCGRRPLQQVAAQGDSVEDILKKIATTADNGNGSGSSGKPAVRQRQQRHEAANGGMGNGLFLILLLNFALFVGCNLLHLPALASARLALDHWRPQWWQFVTATFMHANWQHLSSNAFALLVFGRMVEEEEGAGGLWLTYLLAGVGGTVASYLSAPHTHATSLGASGAVFGLFMVALIAKFKPSLKRLLEFTILGQFVVQQVLGEFAMMAAKNGGATIGGMQIGHVAHLAGAAAGVLLVVFASMLPDPGDS